MRCTSATAIVALCVIWAAGGGGGGVLPGEASSVLPNAAGRRHQRVLVVGAGVAGLASAKFLAEDGQHITVLEATDHIGGTWHYDPRVGLDEYGRPIHTSMYLNLRTNVPYQLMELPGYPYPHTPGTSAFPNGTDYYQYLRGFADYFQLQKHIKLQHEVTLIYRLGDVWRAQYRHVPTGQQFEDEFDFVLVCVGHYSKPRRPNIPGERIFRGSITHSHDYRFPEVYANRTVLIIGAGPSALDLVTTLTKQGSRVLHSHHSKSLNTPFPENYMAKPDVVQYTENGALFRDGTYEGIDDVLYGTGYELNFPFLHESCGLISTPSSLMPLYRTLLNIAQPTMLVLGLTIHACAIITLVTQARYATAVVGGRAKIPSRQHMYREWRRQADELVASRKKMSELHAVNVGWENLQYYDNLTVDAGIARVPPVLPAMCATDALAKGRNFYTFRDYEYTVLDEEHFTRVPVHGDDDGDGDGDGDSDADSGVDCGDCDSNTEVASLKTHPVIVLD